MMHCPNLAELPPPTTTKRGWLWTEESVRVPETIPDGNPLPRISIVTPSYNQGKFIEETVRSVLLQGYPNLEYLVIDGGSTDESVTIIRKYAPWLTYWVSERDQGQSDAINKGWRRCTGDIIAWLNSDDCYAPNALGAVARAFAAHGFPAMVYGRQIIMDQRGNQTRVLDYRASPDQMLGKMLYPHQPAAFFNRSVLETIGFLDPSLHYAMDQAFLLKLMATHHPIYVPAALALNRIYPTTKTGTGQVQWGQELLRVRDDILRHWADYPLLHPIGQARVRSNFHRLASTHFYLGGAFQESLRQIVLACQAHPSASLSILSDVGVRWLVRRCVPMAFYRRLSTAWLSTWSMLRQPRSA
jgi:glycosyltransferase involved in cell wall biosynthesis